MLPNHRSQDAVIHVLQDNQAKDILIHTLNSAAETMLGKKAAALKGTPLAGILPARIAKLLQEYVEYQPEGNDVGGVLGKVASFCVVSNIGEEVALRLKVARAMPVAGHDQFALVLQTAGENRRSEAFRALLRENFRGHQVLDQSTQLPDRQSMNKNVEFALFYVNKKELTASVAVVELDEYDVLQRKYGDAVMAKIFSHMAHVCKQHIRADDVVGYLAPKRLALVLLDTTSESAKMVLNRLRWLIAAHNMTLENNQTQPLSVRVAYHSLGASGEDKEALEIIERALDSEDISGNSVQEISLP